MDFGAYQIVFIETGKMRLYGELVQQIETRNTCWLRPLSLQLQTLETGEVHLLDVGNGPDIICAGDQIQPVLDTDWITLQEDMAKNPLKCDYAEANQHLRQFLATLLPTR
jgi:hypothetical protein